MDLKERFYIHLSKYTNTEKVSLLWRHLVKSYTESHREYHNLNHLEELFNYFDHYQDSIQNKSAVALSIFYHDVVYQVWKKNNEQKSAEKAIEILQEIRFPYEDLKIIEDLIMCTKNHTSLTPDQGFMIDFDLAILGQKNDIYNIYSQQIRKEYKIVPELIYNKGRKQVLTHFLEKESIFQTSLFKSKYEIQARINLTKELDQL